VVTQIVKLPADDNCVALKIPPIPRPSFSQPWMPRISLAPRNVFVYDGTNNTIVGGCHQFGTTSISEFFFCLNFFITTPTNYQLFHQETGEYIKQDDGGNLQTGNYFIATTSMSSSTSSLCVAATPVSYLAVTLTNEEARPRNISGGSPDTTVV
jgi:hypothetical protein